jgi:CobQ-like glutamine amidotransferase family enzyme
MSAPDEAARRSTDTPDAAHRSDLRLTIGYLYPSVLSQYGDWGNVLCLQQRCTWRGIAAEVLALETGAPIDPSAVDLFFMGGGADSQQRLIARDLVVVKGDAIRAAIEAGSVALLICAGYQMWGRLYRPFRGDDLAGLGIFDAETIHWAAEEQVRITDITSAGRGRMVGNVVVEWEGRRLVGFENHGGRTYLGRGARPLGRVVVGAGNNGKDRTEGAIYRHAYGTYLHGPVLPKNPALADHLIRLALERRYGEVALTPLDDGLEAQARAVALHLRR